MPQYNTLAIFLFVYACITDVLDGFLARKFSCTTKTGATLDLLSDKFLTIVSLIYAIGRGLPIFPCTLAIFREVVLLSMRSIYVNGKVLFPPQRILGALMVTPIWFCTLLLLNYPTAISFSWKVLYYCYWVIGLIAIINLGHKIISNWKNIIESFKN
jgi:phosphatidylglycerophosphate synthase